MVIEQGGRMAYGYADRKDDYLKRLRRIEGQVRGLQRMVDEDNFCIDILTQVAAATKALQPDRDRLQGLGGGCHLGQDVDAVVVLVDHPLQPAHLTLDPPQPLQVVVLPVRVPVRHATPLLDHHSELYPCPVRVSTTARREPPGLGPRS